MRYRAFFSYARADDRIANWLHRQLDGYRAPKQLVGTAGELGPVPAKLHPIFRDRTDLESGGHVDAALQQALENSETLIVLCTPTSAKSHWVNHEVETFLKLGREAAIFPVIAGGVPDSGDSDTECFPRALRNKGLLAADLREFKLPTGQLVGDGREGGRLKLIAGLLGVKLDALIQRERRRQRRVLAGFVAASVIFAGLAVSAGGFGMVAQRRANTIFEQSSRIAEQHDQIRATVIRTFLQRSTSRLSETERPRVLTTADWMQGVASGIDYSEGEIAVSVASKAKQRQLQSAARYAVAGRRLAFEAENTALENSFRGALAGVVLMAEDQRPVPASSAENRSLGAWPSEEWRNQISPGLTARVLDNGIQYEVSIGIKLDGKMPISIKSAGTEISLSGHDVIVTAIDFSEDRSLVLTGAEDGTTRVWRMADGALIMRMNAHAGGVSAALFSKDAEWVISAGDDQAVRVWSASTGDLLATRQMPSLVSDMQLSEDGRLVYMRLGNTDVVAISLDRFLQRLPDLVHAACSILLTPEQRRFSQQEISEDVLLREIWLQAPEQDRDVCEGVPGLATFGAPAPSTREVIEDIIKKNPDVF